MVNGYLVKLRNAKFELQSEIKTRHLWFFGSLHLFTIYYLLFIFLCMPAFALQFDTSIDDEIRKNYNPSKLEKDVELPVLPEKLDDNVKTLKANSYQHPQQYTGFSKAEQSYVHLRKGKKIRLKLLTGVSDRSPKGTKLTFVSTYPVSTTYYTIPTGTVFKGYVLKSHGPQFTGNGGLIFININAMILNDEVQPINASVTEANSKMIFLNNVKGKRKYISSVFNSSKPGYRFFKKMLGVTGRLASDGSSAMFMPFSFALGILGYGSNVIISPALALFHKGNSVYIREGSEIEIKLLQDVFIYN